MNKFIQLTTLRLYFRWLIHCIGEKAMPKIIELEEDLRNGVLLARIGNYFAAELISLEKIFDLKKVFFIFIVRLNYKFNILFRKDMKEMAFLIVILITLLPFVKQRFLYIYQKCELFLE